MRIYNGFSELIGSTPLFRPRSFIKAIDENADILCKLEYFNPAGSVKDRAAAMLLKDAAEKGFIREGSVIIEPTSGNTGIGLAAIAAEKGYKVILTMPETMSVERRNLLKAYGAQIVLTDGKKGMQGAVEKALQLKEELPGSFIPGQFDNPSNPKAHYFSTGPEIWEDTDGRVDIFVAGVGTGGTLSGVGRYLKEKNPHIKIVAVEPEGSPLLSKGISGGHKIQGIGANFIPENLDISLVDEIIAVRNEDAFEAGRKMARQEGILVGISSGAALWAACELGRRKENRSKVIVALLPDTGDRYLSTEMFDE